MDQRNLTPLSESQYRALKQFIAIVIALLLIGGLVTIFKFYKRHNPDIPFVAAQKVSSDPLSVTRQISINGTPLTIPVPYFYRTAPPSGEHKATLLVAMFPDFSFVTEDYRRLWDRGEWDRAVRIMLYSKAGTRRDLSEIKQSRKRQAKSLGPATLEYGLARHPSGQGGWGEVYSVADVPDEVDFVWCNSDSDPNPQCDLWIDLPTMQMKLGFDKSLLPHWRTLRQKATTLISEFGSSHN